MAVVSLQEVTTSNTGLVYYCVSCVFYCIVVISVKIGSPSTHSLTVHYSSPFLMRKMRKQLQIQSDHSTRQLFVHEYAIMRHRWMDNGKILD